MKLIPLIYFVSRNKKTISKPFEKYADGFGIAFNNLFNEVNIMKNKTPSMGNFNSTPPNNPPPTGKQIWQIHKTRKNQKKRIIEKLKRDGFITSLEMLDMKIFSGSKRISELKEAGYIFMKTQDWNNGGFATYWYKGHKGGSNG